MPKITCMPPTAGSVVCVTAVEFLEYVREALAKGDEDRRN